MSRPSAPPSPTSRSGDRVAYILGPLGAYASGRLYPAERLVRLPDGISFEDAATVLFKGITAQYLLKSTYPVGPGTVVLLYGVAGGLGQIMAPWAKHLGAFVIGVVSKEASVERARALGCDAVLVWGACDLPAEVAALTNGRKADVVYDGIGRDTFGGLAGQPASARSACFHRGIDRGTAADRGRDAERQGLALPDPSRFGGPCHRPCRVPRAGGGRVRCRDGRHHQAVRVEDLPPCGGGCGPCGARRRRLGGADPVEALNEKV